MGFDQRRQLVIDIAEHTVAARPGLRVGVDIEAGAGAEIVGGVLVGIAQPARAGIGRDQRQTMRRRQPLRPRLDHEGLFGAGQTGQVIQRRHRTPFRRRRQVDRKGHRCAGLLGIVPIEAHAPTETGVLGAGFESHQYSTTARMDSPRCIKSKP